MFKPTLLSQMVKGFRSLFRKKARCEDKRAEIAATPQDKGARMPTGAELLCKNLMLLMYNALILVLGRSPLGEVRAMTLQRVHELLLARALWARQDEHATTLWIEPVSSAPERALQEELVRLINDQPLSLHGQPLHLRLADPLRQARPLRFSG